MYIKFILSPEAAGAVHNHVYIGDVYNHVYMKT